VSSAELVASQAAAAAMPTAWARGLSRGPSTGAHTVPWRAVTSPGLEPEGRGETPASSRCVMAARSDECLGWLSRRCTLIRYGYGWR
jgi:hypothetical protein